jgi:hypothetical protein
MAPYVNGDGDGDQSGMYPFIMFLFVCSHLASGPENENFNPGWYFIEQSHKC